ncbi:unnamed protein product [Microthlaspi erraticum]|uniref:Uncharacterized protein n=1 Tax=Microthlaspi erraticum TaxID=1685480 RepID=A0A6D2IWG5_9BRAS|nr:unnamed protein product [Microthlaspi erraticum]
MILKGSKPCDNRRFLVFVFFSAVRPSFLQHRLPKNLKGFFSDFLSTSRLRLKFSSPRWNQNLPPVFSVARHGRTDTIHTVRGASLEKRR